MQPPIAPTVKNAGKRRTGGKRKITYNRSKKRGKTKNWRKMPENIQPPTGLLKARENVELAARAGKYATGLKRGKKKNWRQTQENVEPVSSARKRNIWGQATETLRKASHRLVENN